MFLSCGLRWIWVRLGHLITSSSSSGFKTYTIKGSFEDWWKFLLKLEFNVSGHGNYAFRQGDCSVTCLPRLLYFEAEATGRLFQSVNLVSPKGALELNPISCSKIQESIKIADSAESFLHPNQLSHHYQRSFRPPLSPIKVSFYWMYETQNPKTPVLANSWFAKQDLNFWTWWNSSYLSPSVSYSL